MKFSRQRGRPAADLIAQIDLNSPKTIIDLGCGTGTSTEQLHQRWPNAEITGLDSSPKMLDSAREVHPEWQWIESGIESWQPDEPYDLVFSNAALHWVPDHGRLFPALLNAVADRGILAIQMPNNFQAPAHLAMKKGGADSRWAGALGDAAENIFIQPAAFYYNALRKFARSVNIWETEYFQVMDGPRAVLDWMRSTAMRPYLSRLANDVQRNQFEQFCLEEYERLFPGDDQGKSLFPYKRMFIVACK
ncbi:MAG TPA: methyltransferase domain-containing protein [Candidatus Limnocylindrales bacterium]|nr:methyltransferase domain-containing protein [Candidatus Limnocylindrales bacterium]